MNSFKVGPDLLRGLEQLGRALGNAAGTPVLPKRSPATRSPGAQFEGLSNFRSPDGASQAMTRRSALPGQDKGVGAQMLGSMLHTASHVLPPGLASLGTHAVGDMLMSPMIGNGALGNDAIADAEAQSDQTTMQEGQMAAINNRAKVAGMLINRESDAISALTSIGNKGSADAVKAATGQ